MNITKTSVRKIKWDSSVSDNQGKTIKPHNCNISKQTEKEFQAKREEQVKKMLYLQNIIQNQNNN